MKLIAQDLKVEVEKYGWTGEEEFEPEDAASMVLKAFELYDHKLFMQWKDLFRDEIEEVFTFETSEEEKMQQKFEIHIEKFKSNAVLPFRDVKK